MFRLMVEGNGGICATDETAERFSFKRSHCVFRSLRCRVCVCVLFICVYDYYARANGKNATLA